MKELLDSKLLLEGFDDLSHIHYYCLNPNAGAMMEEVVDRIFGRS